MAHEFVILNTSGVTTTYTSYEAIPVDSTLKNVIKFVPDLGTLVDANEILIEDTLETQTFDTNTILILDGGGEIIEQIFGNSTSVGTDFVIKNSSDTTLITIKQLSSSSLSPSPVTFLIKNSSGTTLSTLTFSSSSINSGTTFTQNVNTGFNDKLIPEDWTTGSENHLVLETSADSVVSNHYHPPTQDHHVAGDGHTAEEHREIALWNHKLQLLMIQERLNASSN